MLQPSQLSESEESILCNISIAFRQASFLAASSEDCGVPTTSSSGALAWGQKTCQEKKPYNTSQNIDMISYTKFTKFLSD